MSYIGKQSKPDSEPTQKAAKTSAAAAFVDQRASTAAQLKQQQIMNSRGYSNPIKKNSESGQEKQRSKEQMQVDVDNASLEVGKLIGGSETTSDVEAHFPSIKNRYKLKKIEFNEVGEVEIEINPKATISSSKKLISSGSQPAGDRVMNVTYTTGSLGGDVVGMKMEANPIGPNHPQGGPPSSSAQKTLMSKLETNPENSGENKYIKGHLLNDNIGGPGIAENLFPITAIANKKHHDEVEATVKDWVNNKGYWVYYNVEASIDSSSLGGSKSANKVNAKFKCTAYPLTASGGKSNQSLSKTIVSEKGTAKSSTGDGLEVDMGGTAAAKDSQFNYSPELSTSKSKLNSGLDVDLVENLKWIYEESPDSINELGEISGIGDKTLEALITFLKTGQSLPQRYISSLGNKDVLIYAKISEIYDNLENS